MGTGEILKIVLRNPMFWAIAGGSLAVAVVARLLISGWIGELISDTAFLGAAFAGGSFARAAAGLPQRRKP